MEEESLASFSSSTSAVSDSVEQYIILANYRINWNMNFSYLFSHARKVVV